MSKYKIRFKDREFDASEYQDAIFDNVEHGVGNMNIVAAAGASKTTTIVNCLNIIPDSKKVLFIAFNRDIVADIKERVGEKRNTKISTFHSLGLSIFKENHGDIRDDSINEFKYRNYIKSNIGSISESFGKLPNKVRNEFIQNVIRLSDYSRYYNAFMPKDIEALSDKYGIALIGDECETCRKVLQWGSGNTDEIDYTDMIWLPNVLNYTTRKYRYNWVLVDEAQDISIAEQKLIEKCYMRGCRVVTVGDMEQMINIWAGSDEQAIENFRRMPNTREFRLPISYRCPKKVVEVARRYSSNIIAKDDAIDGEVNYGVSVNKPTDGDMVLCRVTAPLVDLHMKYLRINKKSYLIGQENIIEQYMSLIDSVDSIVVDQHMLTKNGMFPELYRRLLSLIEQVSKAHGLDDEDALSHPAVLSMYDEIQGLRVLSEGITSVEELKKKINDVFSCREEGIRLSTVHKAKGLEADNVYIYLPSLMPIKYAKKEWEIRTERNLIYVAVTRARKTLNYIEEPRFRRNADGNNGFNVGNIKDEIVSIRKRLGVPSSVFITEKQVLENKSQGIRKVRALGDESGNPNVGKKKRKAAMKMADMLD